MKLVVDIGYASYDTVLRDQESGKVLAWETFEYTHTTPALRGRAFRAMRWPGRKPSSARRSWSCTVTLVDGTVVTPTAVVFDATRVAGPLVRAAHSIRDDGGTMRLTKALPSVLDDPSLDDSGELDGV